MMALHDPEDRLSAWSYFDNDFRGGIHHPDAMFVRYMSIFHGIKVYEVGVGSDGTRGLAWVEPSERERVGGSPDSDEGNVRDSLDEYNAWARGECYGYVVQESVTWARVDADGSMGDDLIVRETWEPTDDALWGMVGYEYAERSAREALSAVTA